ncbi:MAG: hypothetical protein IPJ74_09635 [Saprospiraceae bacterium]|nr:hypothetical protein [Saprospiraceae bacterium]
MRILIILTQYYPMLNPNVYRWSAIAEHWVEQGHEVHILCTKRNNILNESIMNGVQVHRTGYATLLDWAYNLLEIRQRRAEINEGKLQKQSLFRRVLEWLVDHTWRMLYYLMVVVYGIFLVKNGLCNYRNYILLILLLAFLYLLQLI